MSYFEAIIQLRPKDQELVHYVKEKIRNTKDVEIAKEIEKKFGTDLYISSKEFAWKIGQDLKKSFNGILKVSKKTFSIDRRTSKTIYRHTICFRLEK